MAPAMVAALAAALGLAACGGSAARQRAASDPSFPVQITAAQFPRLQRLAEHTHMVISVRNAGSQTIPNVTVTVCNVTCAYPAPSGQGTSSGAFASNVNGTGLANPSRPVWIVEKHPGTCGFSCRQGGAGSAATSYANTWALGPLAPGATATFEWLVTAVTAGRHVVAWQVAAGLSGNNRAVLAGGGAPVGSFAVRVSGVPPQAYVNNSGQVVATP